MNEQSDQAIYASLRKTYGSARYLPKAELRRRLLMTPELFYFADQLIEQGLTRGILRPTGEDLVLATWPDLGQLPF